MNTPDGVRICSLLRARGDRPFDGPVNTSVQGSPPRTRRSTRVSRGLLRERCVSSAHAEIDPRSTSLRPLVHRLLRARGDRPGAGVEPLDETVSPPRTRRSTLPETCARRLPTVSSAHAEIDPDSVTDAHSIKSLLRARGDRPGPYLMLKRTFKSPPRTRRSTLFPSLPAAVKSVSSAHAEIDLVPISRAAIDAGLLRARGDRP